jgi:hypothetical protein
MAEILLWLSISSNINENNSQLESNGRRKQQYIEGINKLFEFQFHEKVDIHLFDNTVDVLDDDLLAALPTRVSIHLHVNNEYGCRNKGAGILSEWIFYKDLIASYKYVIHFEPRQLLINHDFFDLKFDQSVFYDGPNYFYTGLFMIDSNILLDYIKSKTPVQMCKNKISLEYDLYDFVKKEHHSYNSVTNLHLIWHDTAANCDRIF